MSIPSHLKNPYSTKLLRQNKNCHFALRNCEIKSLSRIQASLESPLAASCSSYFCYRWNWIHQPGGRAYPFRTFISQWTTPASQRRLSPRRHPTATVRKLSRFLKCIGLVRQISLDLRWRCRKRSPHKGQGCNFELMMHTQIYVVAK